VLLIFVGEKSTKPTAVPLFSQPIIELHLRVEFKQVLYLKAIIAIEEKTQIRELLI